MNHHSECFLDNENNITYLSNHFIIFSRQCKKMKRDWDFLFFNYVKIK